MMIDFETTVLCFFWMYQSSFPMFDAKDQTQQSDPLKILVFPKWMFYKKIKSCESYHVAISPSNKIMGKTV